MRGCPRANLDVCEPKRARRGSSTHDSVPFLRRFHSPRCRFPHGPRDPSSHLVSERGSWPTGFSGSPIPEGLLRALRFAWEGCPPAKPPRGLARARTVGQEHSREGRRSPLSEPSSRLDPPCMQGQHASGTRVVRVVVWPVRSVGYRSSRWGSRTVKQEPTPFSLSTSIVPPKRSTRCFVTASPRPVPS